jgi:Trypsin
MASRRMGLRGTDGAPAAVRIALATAVAFVLLCSGVASAAPMPRAHAAIAGGTQIAIAQAPWQAEVFVQFGSGEGIACGGAIIDSEHILTAASCTFDAQNGKQLAASAFEVVAGTASVTPEEIEDNEAVQASLVSAVRVHPMFEYALGPEAPDNVAVLTLKTPLMFNETVQPIGLVAADETLAEGAAVNLTGFGEQLPGIASDQALHSLGMTVGFSRRCGGEADAVFVCASAPQGSGCTGDGGSGLTAGGETPVLVGVMDTVEVVAGAECGAGAVNGFVNLAAPEIRDFIAGSETPPAAPRGGGVRVRAVPKVGEVVTCEPGTWTGSPVYTYAFIDSTSGQTLQSGPSSTYQLTTADLGATIYCQVWAANAGGTGIARTTALRAVEAAPQSSSPPTTGGSTSTVQTQSSPPAPPVVSLVGTTLTARHGRSVTIKLACEGSGSCSGKLALQAKQTKRRKGRETSRTVTIGVASFSIAAGKTTSVTLHFTGTGRVLVNAGHGRLTASLRITQAATGKTETQTVHLVEGASHRGGV